VLALVGNAIVLSVQDRVREHAILQTLGYRSGLIARLIVSEGALLGLIGGVVGTVAAVALLRWKSYSLSTEGLSIEIRLGAGVLLLGLLVSASLGVVAGLVPAWRASRQEITASFRAV
jgi:putative ABC transport system permease protein